MESVIITRILAKIARSDEDRIKDVIDRIVMDAVRDGMIFLVSARP